MAVLFDLIPCQKYYLLGEIELNKRENINHLYRMRLGFVTAPVPLLEKLVYHQQVTSMHASSLSQVKFFLQIKGLDNVFILYLLIDGSIKII